MNAADNPRIELLFNISADDEHVLGLDVADRIFGFHAQQTVEKLYKVLISAHGEEYPFTHNLETRRKLSELGEIMPNLPLALEHLTEFSVQTRYDEMPPLSLEYEQPFAQRLPPYGVV